MLVLGLIYYIPLLVDCPGFVSLPAGLLMCRVDEGSVAAINTDMNERM
jgi:hypothetical protein